MLYCISRLLRFIVADMYSISTIRYSVTTRSRALISPSNCDQPRHRGSFRQSSAAFFGPLLTRLTRKSLVLALALLALLATAASPAAAVSHIDGICSRTWEVRDLIIDLLRDSGLVAEGATCRNVEHEDLRAFGANSFHFRLNGKDYPNLDSLKEGDFRNMRLEFLTVKNSKLWSLPENFSSDLGRLEILYLGNNKLYTLSEEVFDGLTALRTLGLNNNNFWNLHPNVFSALTALKNLYLTDNRLTTLPEGIFTGLTALETLNLSDNRLTTLPEGIFSGLTALKTLYLSDNNSLTELPLGIFSGLTALKTLDLNDNSLTALLAEGIFSDLTALKTLKLNGNGLTALPGRIFSGLTALETLDLGGGGLTALPEEVFSGLTALETLDLSGGGLTALPEEVFASAFALKTLDLGSNSLTVLPWDIFFGLTALKTLVLNGNRLTALPGEIFASAFALETLDLAGNSLTELSMDLFTGRSRLKTLRLGQNSLTELPGYIFSSLHALETLELEGNPGSEGFRPIANAGADQAAKPGQVVTLMASISDDDPWGDNVSYLWTRTDDGIGSLNLMDATTASPSFVMPGGVAGVAPGATAFEFELEVTGRGGRDGDGDVNPFVDRDRVRVHHAAVVTLTGPGLGATTAIVGDSIRLVYGYDVAGLHGRALALAAGKIEVTVAVDGVAVTPTIHIVCQSCWYGGARVEIIIVLGREAYSNPAGHLLAVSLSAVADGFVVLDEPSSITTPFRFVFPADPSVCDRTEQVRDAIVALSPVSDCADITNIYLAGISVLDFSWRSIVTLQEGDFAGLTRLNELILKDNSLTALPEDIFVGLTDLYALNLDGNNLMELSAGIFSSLPSLRVLNLKNNSLTALPRGVFSGLTDLSVLSLKSNNLMELSADVFSGLPSLRVLHLKNNSLTVLPGGVFSGLSNLNVLSLDGNPGSEGFRPIANAGANQTVVAGQSVILSATVSGDDPWGDNVRYVWTRTDNSSSSLTLMDAETARPSFVMPAGATILEFELRVTGRGGDHFFGTDSLKVRHPDPNAVVVTLTGPVSTNKEPVATTYLLEDSIELLYKYSTAGLHDRAMAAGDIEVTAAVDGVTIKIRRAKIDVDRGRGGIFIVLDKEAYPHPDGYLLAVSLRLSASAVDDFIVLGEPSSITTPFNFVLPADPSVCDRSPGARDAIVAALEPQGHQLVPVSDCADITNTDLAGIDGLLLFSRPFFQPPPPLQEDDFAGLIHLSRIVAKNGGLTALPAGIFADLTDLTDLDLSNNNLTKLSADVFSDLRNLGILELQSNNLTALPGGVFAGLTNLKNLYLKDNNLMELSADVFSDLRRLRGLRLDGNSLTALPGGVFSSNPVLNFLLMSGNPGSEGFRPIANAGDQTAMAGQLVTLTATVSDDDPWGDNVRYLWTRTDNSSSSLTLMDADTASPSFVMPAGTTGLEFELRVTGRGHEPRSQGGAVYVGTDSLKVSHPAVVTLTGPEPAATTEIVEESISLVYTYSVAEELHGRVLEGKIEVTAAVDGVAVTPEINIDEASGQGEITVVLRRQEYPDPDGHLLAVTLRLSAGAAAEGFVLGEPGSITTPFRFVFPADPSVCDRTEQVRDAIVALVPVSDCADVTNVHLDGIEVLNFSGSSIETLQESDFAGLTSLRELLLSNNSLEALPAGIFSGLTDLRRLYLNDNNLMELSADIFSGLTALVFLRLNNSHSSLTALPEGIFAGLTALENLYLSDNKSMELPADVFSGLPVLSFLNLERSRLTELPGGIFSGLPTLRFLFLAGNPGSEGFLPIANAGADQTAGAGQVVTLTATASDADPWGGNVSYVWTRTDNSGSPLTLMGANTASPSFVMPADATELEFELRVTGRGRHVNGSQYVGTDSLKVRHPDAVVTLTGPEPAATTTNVVEESISLVYTYNVAGLHDRILAGNIEVTAAIDGVAVTPDINIDEARGQGEITVVLRRQEYPGPIGHLLAVTLRLSASAAAEGFVLGEPSSITTPFRFAPSVCARTEQVRDAIVASVPVSHCADVTDVDLADIGALNLSRRSIVTLQEGDFAGLTNLSQIVLSNNSLAALPAGVFSGLPALLFLNLNNNSLEALPAGVFSGLPSLRFLYLDGNPGSEGFRPIADAGADQTAVAAQVVILTATASGDDPWGDNVRYVWTRTDNSGSELTLMDAETASPSFVMPADATGLEFELRVTGRGGDHFVGTDSLKVRHPDAVVTLTGPEPAAPTTEIVENEFSLVFTYSAADLHGRVLAGKIEVTAAVDGVAITPTINIDEASGQGEITVVLRRQEYPGPIGHLLAVTLRLSASAAAEGFVLGEPSSITTPFSFFSSVDPSVCARTEQVRDAILASVPVSDCADVTEVDLAGIGVLNLSGRPIVTLQEGDFAGLTNVSQLLLSNNSLEALPAGVFSGLPALLFLNLNNNSLEALPAGVFSGLTALDFLLLDGNPGSEGFRPIADAGADQTAGAAQVVTLTATASGDDPWGDNVRYVWTRTDNSGSELTLMDAETASPSFVMPAGATGLEFELRVTGRGGDHFVGTDSLKVRHPDAVVTLTGPVLAATTTNVVEESISLVYTYSAVDLHGRVLAGNLEVTAAVDGVAIIPDINIDEASGQGEITVVLRRQEYPGPIGHLLAVTLSLSAAAEGFVLGEPNSITTPFSFFSSVDPSVCARTEQVRDAIVASVPVSHCADVTDVDLAGIGALNLSRRSIVTLQEGDFAGLTNLSQLLLSNNSLEALPAGVFSGLPALLFLNLNNNSLEALPAGVFSGLPSLIFLYLDGNPGSEGFRPIADAGADQTAAAAQVVTLTATASGDDPWGDNVHYVWTRTDNSGSELTLMDAETASPSFVMPAGATGLEFELRVTGRGGAHFVGTDSLKVRHPDPNAVVVTLTGPEPAATTTNIVEDSINLVYTYSAADLHGRVLAGKIEVAAAVDGVAIIPDINIDEARGQGEITVVLRRQEYPNPIGHVLAVTLSLSASATAEGFVLGEPSSITTPFRFRAVDGP